MGVTKPSLPRNDSSVVLSKVRDGRIAKPEEPIPPFSYPAIIDQPAGPNPASSHHTNKDYREVEDIEVYMVMVEHKVQYLDAENDIFKLCPDLEEANGEARRYLEEHEDYGPDVEWDEYQETVEADGRIQLEAAGGEGENFMIRVEKKVMKRKIPSKGAASRPKPKDSSAIAEPATFINIDVNHEQSHNEETIFMVITEYRETGFPDKIKVITQCPDLEEANGKARRCLDEEYGPGIDHWGEYQERIEADGSMRIRASGCEEEEHVVRIEKKVIKRLPKPRNEPLGYSYVVLVEYRKNVHEFNEEGDIDWVAIESIHGNLQNANNFLRSLVEENRLDREHLDVDENEEEGLLHITVLDQREGEKVVYGVEKHPVWTCFDRNALSFTRILHLSNCITISAIKTLPLRKNTSSTMSSRIQNGRVAKSQKPVAAIPNPAVIDLTAAPDATSSRHTHEGHEQLENEEVYTVIVNHTHPYMETHTFIFKLCPNLEEANREARRWLNSESGPTMDLDDFEERIEADGSVRIRASAFEADNFLVRVERELMKRKIRSKRATGEVKPTNGTLKHVYIVKVENRKHICGSNEDGEIDSVEIQGTYRKPEDANNFLRSLVEERMEDDFECDEHEEEGLLHMSVLDMMEGEQVVYDVEKQRVW